MGWIAIIIAILALAYDGEIRCALGNQLKCDEINRVGGLDQP